MSRLFVDSSAIVAIALGESSADEVRVELAAATDVLASGLLEAEVRSACRRERRQVESAILAGIELIHPADALTTEIDRVLDAGHLAGADCWHLAVALLASPFPGDCLFLTLDVRQRAVAKKLGFRV